MKDISTQIFNLLEKNPQAVILTENYNVTHANNRAAKIFGSPKNKLINLPLNKLFSPETVSEIRKNVFDQLKTGNSIHFEGSMNSDPAVVLSISQTIDLNGNVILFIIDDISKQKEIVAAKDQILEMMAQHLRGPLTNIIGYLDLLKKEKSGKLSDQQRKFVELAFSNSNFIFRIVADLLDLSKIESGSFALDFEEVSLNEIVNSIKESYRYFFEEKGLELVIGNISKKYIVSADKFRLSQIINNILDNALKFTESGYVKVTVSPHKDTVIIKIEDTGVGIQTKFLKNVFNKFFRTDSIQSVDNPGIGLGLTISKYFTELHRGKISFDTKKGKGRTFCIELPLLRKEEI